jgi:Bacterial SH3 domain
MVRSGLSGARAVTARVPVMSGLILLAIATLAISTPTYAAGTEEDVPATSIVPSGGESAPAAAKSPSSASTLAPAGVVTPTAPAAKSKPATHHRMARASRAPEVEPAEGRLKLVEDSWVYSAPSKKSKQLERVVKDKFVNVTGSTHYFLQVRLKDGETGYLDPSAVSLFTPADKVFVLTHDAAVLDKPNRWGKKVAEVHKTHNVHVIGVALSYMRIKMKSGLEGFIPTSALE